ncbi:DUF1007 family protein [Paracoccus aestuariivivens]|uniref:DUF1007 family protein n=1 Tax=Paracoccus aestuariivivens TaxID=1820333 RepID=A0A6L6J8T3_9RHOB|nr:DUF1007 family protein [Paracoccus aestuariivivens]MTH78502.1 DUF1007 family protein [Paracoccus aestuariivivens]
MRSGSHLAALLLLLPLSTPANAHPHVFIDTDFSLVFSPSGELQAIRVDWAYDEFYSLLMIEENGLDSDGDGTPEQERLDAFAGQDVDWAAGFPGDFSVEIASQPVTLRGPEQHKVRFENGRVITSHIRPLASAVAVAGADIVARSYDPSYFVAYDVPKEPRIDGRDDCRVRRDKADEAAAQAKYGEKLAALDVTDDPFQEIEIPDIGILFADSFVVSCDAPS